VGIINEKGKILADEREIYIPPLGKGIIPQEAAEHHESVKEKVFEKVLQKTKMSLKDIDIIAYSAGPGLPLPLIKTANFAIRLAKKYEKVCVPINHMLAHVEIGKLLTKSKDPVVVYLSGGNTMIMTFTEGRYRIMGETLDLPLGNAIDMVARELNLPSPGGPEIEKLALKGSYLPLPYVVKGCDLSFTGIVTRAINLFKEGAPREDIAYSLQEVCFSMVTEVTERVLAHTNKNEVLLVGGVAANKRLCKILSIMCEERGAKMYVVPAEYAADNPVMIAWTGLLAYKYNCIPQIKDKILPKWRIDEVPICWIKILK